MVNCVVCLDPWAWYLGMIPTFKDFKCPLAKIYYCNHQFIDIALQMLKYSEVPLRVEALRNIHPNDDLRGQYFSSLILIFIVLVKGKIFMSSPVDDIGRCNQEITPSPPQW